MNMDDSMCDKLVNVRSLQGILSIDKQNSFSCGICSVVSDFLAESTTHKLAGWCHNQVLFIAMHYSGSVLLEVIGQ